MQGGVQAGIRVLDTRVWACPVARAAHGAHRKCEGQRRPHRRVLDPVQESVSIALSVSELGGWVSGKGTRWTVVDEVTRCTCTPTLSTLRTPRPGCQPRLSGVDAGLQVGWEIYARLFVFEQYRGRPTTLRATITGILH